MLARQNRFRGRTSLSLVFKKGRATRHGGLLVRHYPAKNDNLRAAVVVSRQVHKSAVVRNRIRRRVYDFIGRELDQIKPCDVIVSVYDAQLADIEFEAFQKTMTEAFKKANLLP